MTAPSEAVSSVQRGATSGGLGWGGNTTAGSGRSFFRRQLTKDSEGGSFFGSVNVADAGFVADAAAHHPDICEMRQLVQTGFQLSAAAALSRASEGVYKDAQAVLQRRKRKERRRQSAGLDTTKLLRRHLQRIRQEHAHSVRAGGSNSRSLSAMEAEVKGALLPTITHKGQEQRFHTTEYQPAAARNAQTAILVAICASIAYLALEIVVEPQPLQIALRSVLVVGLAAVFLMLKSPTLSAYYDQIMFTVLILGGVTKSLIITDDGEFGQILFQMSVLLALRLSLSATLFISVVDLLVYLTVRVTTQSATAGDLPVFIIFLFIVVGFSFLSANSLHRQMRKGFLQRRDLVHQREMSARVLDNMYPAHVSKKILARGGGSWGGEFCQEEPEVTVMFCDVVEFDQVTASRSPSQLVQVMDELYSLFDAISDKHGVWKMETVGKTYMACAGIQGSRSDHAAAAIYLGLDIINSLRLLQNRAMRLAETAGGQPRGLPSALTASNIRVKVGIHTGRVVSGVVGLKKPQYCLFGDTVNTAARMCSSSDAGRVQISPSTRAKLGNRFLLSPRDITVKSKGQMTTFLVDGIAMGTPYWWQPEAHAAIFRQPSSSKSAGAAVRRSGRQKDRDSLPGRSLSAKTPTGRHSDAYLSTHLSPAPPGCFGDSPLSREEARRQLATTQKRMTAAERKEANQRRLEERRIAVSPITLRYGDELLEQAFHAERRHRVLRTITIVGAALFVLFVFRTLESALGRDGLQLREAYLRMSFLAVIVIFTLGIHAPEIRSASAMRFELAINAFLLMAAIIAVLANNQARNASLDVLLIFALHANSGTATYLSSMVGNVVIFLVAVLLQALVPWYMPPNSGVPLTPGLTFFLAAGVVVTAVGAYSSEYFARRTFALEGLTQERANKTHGVLYKMLPGAVISQLNEGRTAVSDHFRGVSILFCDIKGFTRMSASVQPGQVVSLLNRMFSKFDRLGDRFGAFKVQTIGDAYVVASGLPYTDTVAVDPIAAFAAKQMEQRKTKRQRELERRGEGDGSQLQLAPGLAEAISSHRQMTGGNTAQMQVLAESAGHRHGAEEVSLGHVLLQRRRGEVEGGPAASTQPEWLHRHNRPSRVVSSDAGNLVELALAMQEAVSSIKHPTTGEPIQMRVGIHTGDIIGGVIGKKTLRYDIWSTDVLVANSMESSGQPERILVSQNTKDLLEPLDRYSFEPHRQVPVDGYGDVMTYFVSKRVAGGPPKLCWKRPATKQRAVRFDVGGDENNAAASALMEGDALVVDGERGPLQEDGTGSRDLCAAATVDVGLAAPKPAMTAMAMTAEDVEHEFDVLERDADRWQTDFVAASHSRDEFANSYVERLRKMRQRLRSRGSQFRQFWKAWPEYTPPPPASIPSPSPPARSTPAPSQPGVLPRAEDLPVEGASGGAAKTAAATTPEPARRAAEAAAPATPATPATPEAAPAMAMAAAAAPLEPAATAATPAAAAPAGSSDTAASARTEAPGGTGSNAPEQPAADAGEGT